MVERLLQVLASNFSPDDSRVITIAYEFFDVNTDALKTGLDFTDD